MKVMITGGTGFVGSHTVSEVIKAGHQVKLLIRSPDVVRPALEPLGIGEVESEVGDVTDQASVERALEGCDAVIHCASVYSLDPRAASGINRTNVDGTEVVIGTAHNKGLDPIIHVSSMVALIGERGKELTPDSVPTRPKGVYPRSKANSDRVARRYQENGAPVVITYPGMVWGPNDPHVGDTCQIAKAILQRFWTIVPIGGTPISDVRDTAKLHAEVLEQGRGPRRYMSPSGYLSIKDMVETLSEVTGRWLPCVTLPGWTLTWPMRIVDGIQFISSIRMPFNFQAVYIGALNHAINDSLTRTEFGIVPRAIEESMADTIRWMYENNHLSRRLAGRSGV